MENFSARRLTTMGLIAAIYVVSTMLCSSLAYGQVQFRISEALMLLCFYNKDYIISLTVGCLIVNLFSTLGLVDVVFGTLATLVAAVAIYLLRNKTNLIVASLMPVISNAVIVGFELTYVFKTPLLANMGWVALGEFVCVSVVGVILVSALMKNKYVRKIVTMGVNDQSLEEQFRNG